MQRTIDEMRNSLGGESRVAHATEAVEVSIRMIKVGYGVVLGRETPVGF